MLLKILKDSDPSLRTRCKEVTEVTKELLTLVEDMKETMLHNNGVGLAANQVGRSERLIIVDVGAEHLRGAALMVMFNPKIVKIEGDSLGIEGCLSFPERKVLVPRAEKIVVEFLNIFNKKESYSFKGLPSTIIQHEVDHLNGKLMIDYENFQ